MTTAPDTTSANPQPAGSLDLPPCSAAYDAFRALPPILRGCTDWADFYAGWQAALEEHQPSCGSKELVRRLSRAEVIVRDLLSLAPLPSCELFHHSKKDQHQFGEPCPCVERYSTRLKAAKDFLSAPNIQLRDGASRRQPDSAGRCL